jgi:hypothetical protein
MADDEKDEKEPWGEGPDVPLLTDAKNPLAEDENGDGDADDEARKWVPPIP